MMDSSASRSSIWWKGALKSAAKQFLVGATIGALCAVALHFAIIPAFATVFPGLPAVFSGFLSLPSAAGTAPAFSMVPLMVFNGAISSTIGLLTGGSQALAEYAQTKRQAQEEARLQAVEGKVRVQEYAAAPSRVAQTILHQGQRKQGGFAAAEQAREASAGASAQKI